MTSPRSSLTKIIFFSAEAFVAAVVVSFAAADFFAVGCPGCPVYLVDCLVVFVAEFFVVAGVADFAAFFFYPFFQGCANLYVRPHLQIRVLPLVALMKSIQRLPVHPE